MSIYQDNTGRKFTVRPYQQPDVWNEIIHKKYKIAFLRPDAHSQFDWERYVQAKWHDTPEAAEAELEEWAKKKGWTLVV